MAGSPPRTGLPGAPIARLLPGRRAYDGSAIASQWAYRALGIPGDSAIAFLGPCDVATDRLVDLADRRAGSFLRAAEMLHLILEHFGEGIDTAVWRQRLLAALVAERLGRRRIAVLRDGNDLFVRGRKLSVCVAAAGPLGSKIHMGINVDPEGAPVPAIGLRRLGVPARPFAREILAAYVRECAGAAFARAKVLPPPPA